MVCMQTARNAATNQRAVHGAGDRIRQCPQLQEPLVQLANAQHPCDWNHARSAVLGVRVAPNREVRTSALQCHGGHATQHASVLNCAAHILAKSVAERVEMLRVVQLQGDRSHADPDAHKRASVAFSGMPMGLGHPRGKKRCHQRRRRRELRLVCSVRGTGEWAATNHSNKPADLLA
eukprot:6206356-Prymnesium_polylepis.1